MTTALGGRPRGFSETTLRRLAAWRRGCALDRTTAEIAAGLGVSVVALQRCVQRARAVGHPDAVLHPRSPQRMAGTGFSPRQLVQGRQARFLQQAGAER